MDEQERNSLKIVISFIFPVWIISNVFELLLYKTGLTSQISGFAVALSSLLEKDWKEFAVGLVMTLFAGIVAVGFLDWSLSKLIGFKKFRPDAWRRALILGVIFGFATPLLGIISDNSTLNLIVILIVISLVWILFRNYSLTTEKSNE